MPYVDVEGPANPFDDTWDDLIAVIEPDTGQPLATENFRDTDYQMQFFRHDVNLNVFTKYQIPHSWNVGSSVHPHIHVVPMTTGSGDVKMNYVYTWSRVADGPIPPSTGWVSGSVITSFDENDEYQQKVIDLGNIDAPANSQASIVLLMKLERDADSEEDTYTQPKDHSNPNSNLGVLFIDLHFQRDKSGTETEHPEF